jgi:HlyD family secretion protein
MFREQGKWAVFVVDEGKTQLKKIAVERNNGTLASVTEGVEPGEMVVLYPSAELSDNTSVVSR